MWKDNINRGTRLTIEIFPSLYFLPFRFDWEIEYIVDRHEDKIGRAVLKVLRGVRSSRSAPVSTIRILDAVMDLGAELLRTALHRTPSRDGNTPLVAYDEFANKLYEEVLGFVKKK